MGILDGLIMSEPKPEIRTDFKDFLKFMKFLESRIFEQSEDAQKTYFDFKNLIEDLNRTAVTGSAILYYRLGQQYKAKDIDIFIEDNKTNKDIVANFFINPGTRLILEEFYQKELKKYQGKQHEKCGKLETTSFKDNYQLLKGDCLLDTMRFSYAFIGNDGFNLNFIFSRRLTRAERPLVKVQDRLTASLYDSVFKDRNGEISFASIGPFDHGLTGQEILAIDKIYPKSIAMHLVNDTFDFEELKFVYSFQLQQVISTLIASKVILEKFIVDIRNLVESGELREPLAKLIGLDITNTIKTLETRNKNFVDMTQEPKSLTISENTVPGNARRAIQILLRGVLKGSPMEIFFAEMTSIATQRVIRDIYNTYHGVFSRIPKYQKNGFTIEDPSNILANMQMFITGHHNYIMGQSNINNIASKAGLLFGDKISTKQLKVLRSTYKALEDLNSKNNITINIEDVPKDTSPEIPKEVRNVQEAAQQTNSL